MELKIFKLEPCYKNSFVVLYGDLYIGTVYYVEEWDWWGMGCNRSSTGEVGMIDKHQAVEALIEFYLEITNKKFNEKKVIQLIEVK